MMEFEGDVISLGNTDVKLRMFKNKVVALEIQIKNLTTLLEQRTSELKEANEKISYFRGRLNQEGKVKAASKRPPKKRWQVRKNFKPQVAET
jgi:predicted  nucleic acid-binding Zn-ribbon protein